MALEFSITQRVFQATMCISALWLVCSCSKLDPVEPPHSTDSTELYKAMLSDPQSCATCHPMHVEEWQSSMHAYAMTDPIFFRLHDIGKERNPELGNYCFQCHSPGGVLTGEILDGVVPEVLSAPARAGVSCEVCHTVSDARRGEGVHALHLDSTMRGPIEDPVFTSAHKSVFSRSISKSQSCAACHDLNSVSGFLAERTNTEWDESPYQAMGVECQDCHMPSRIGVAALGGPEREVHSHRFIGLDVPLTDFPDADKTHELVAELMRNAISLSVEPVFRAPNNHVLNVHIVNDKTGHSVPSGSTYDREMWVSAVVTTESGDTVFATGLLDPNTDLRTERSVYVQTNELELDTNLTLFRGEAYSGGEKTLFFWEAESADLHLIDAFASHTSTFRPNHLVEPGTMIYVSVEVLIRPFPPYLLRHIGMSELIDRIPVFTMADTTFVVEVE